MAINIELIKSLNGRSDKQVATANSLGLRKIGIRLVSLTILRQRER